MHVTHFATFAKLSKNEYIKTIHATQQFSYFFIHLSTTLHTCHTFVLYSMRFRTEYKNVNVANIHDEIPMTSVSCFHSSVIVCP